jgi:uncharacterized protein (DUF2249 family)
MDENKRNQLEWTDELPATVGRQPQGNQVESDGSEGVVVDVRRVAPAQRHPLIFDTFAGLAPGASFVLVNDHDPKPLYYQFAAEHAGEFVWEYLEKGPIDWRVRIEKTEIEG